MILVSHWTNATRVGQERAQVEAWHTESLLLSYGTADAVFAAKEEYHRMYEPPKHHFAYAIRAAAQAATCKLLPSEKGMAHFTIECVP